MKTDAMQQASDHGFSVRGNVAVGTVVSAKRERTCTIERELVKYVKKYERYRKRKVRMQVHVPAYLSVREGDVVRVGETRRISKTKSFVVLEVLAHAKTVAKTDEVQTARRMEKTKSQAEESE